MSLVVPALSFEIASFAAGFMDSPEEDSLAPGATPDARNAMFFNVQTDDGVRAVLRKRKGSRLVNPTAISAGKSIDGLCEFERASTTSELLAVCNGTAYKWDGVSSFSALTAGAGFTAGNRVNWLPFKSNVFIMDGVQQLRYDGTSCKPDGFIAPTAAPALAVVAGPGVTGTYEGFAVWYDSVMDHESSPSATSAAVVFANQQRQWTKPAGAPPANVDNWRIYCRRTDTNELNYFRVGTVPIATGTLTEIVSDTARVDIGPGPSTNDVPPVFELAEEFKGYRVGVTLDSSDIWISKQLDPESQHPKDVFPVGGRGDTKPVRAVRKFGVDCLIQKPKKSWRLVGDVVPFKIEPITGSMGAVSQRSGVEVDGWWYQWDELRGPYRTNLETWESLSDNRIQTILGTINRAALKFVEVVHYRTLNIIAWAIPTTSTRRRTLLQFNYLLGRWLPPITGFEYAALTEFTTPAAAYGVYFGDEWGRVYELFSGEVDGVPSGTTESPITAATAGTITAGAAAFYTTGSGLAGMPALVVSPSGACQWVRIQSNTATVLTLDTTNGPSLSPVPAPLGGANPAWTVIVGGIDWYWFTPRFTGGKPSRKKLGRLFTVQASVTSATHELYVGMRLNREVALREAYAFTFPVAGLVWGSGVFGTDPWGGGGSRDAVKHRVGRAYFDISFKFWNYHPNQPFQISYFETTADWLGRKQVRSA
jgi:hypothetical protein